MLEPASLKGNKWIMRVLDICTAHIYVHISFNVYIFFIYIHTHLPGSTLIADFEWKMPCVGKERPAKWGATCALGIYIY